MAPTTAEGLIKFKYPQEKRDMVEEYGIVEGEWLVLMLQVANENHGEEFSKYLFNN